MRMWCYYCTATVTFVSQVMSTWSSTFNLIEHSRIDDAPAVFPSVRTRKADRRCALIDTGYCRGHHSLLGRRAARSLSCPAVVVPVAVLTGGSPRGFNLAETVLLYVIETLSPTLTSSKRFAPAGTSIVWKFPSGVLMFTMRLSRSMVSTVRERVTVVSLLWSAPALCGEIKS